MGISSAILNYKHTVVVAAGSSSPFPPDSYVTEDESEVYVTEDGSEAYVPES